jgi:hypothetical protein
MTAPIMRKIDVSIPREAPAQAMVVPINAYEMARPLAKARDALGWAAAAEPKRTGTMGRTHGDRVESNPAKNPKP